MLLYSSTLSAEEKVRQWVEDILAGNVPLPFSFEYRGGSSRELIQASTGEQHTTVAGREKDRKVHTITWSCPEDGLRLVFEMTQFLAFPAVEWIVYFENTGDIDSGIIENVLALDSGVEYPPFKAVFGTAPKGVHDVILHYASGSDCKVDDFLPLEEYLHFVTNKEVMQFACKEGRPTSGSYGCMPYFDLQTKDAGVLTAIGWSGQWNMALHMMQKEGDRTGIQFKGGMPDMHLKLFSGEKIRSPRILFMPYTGDRIDAHNIYRKFMLQHHTPHINGEPVMPLVSISSWGLDEKTHLDDLEKIHELGYNADTYWIDAGWYGPPGTKCNIPTENDWADNVGFFTHDPVRYPNGLKPVSDLAHKYGMKFLLWIEPERAVYGTPVTLEHPEYFLGETGARKSLLFNLGKPEALNWMIEFLSGKITEYGIDVLRIDYNFDPLDKWERGDTEERRGMTQIRCVEGFYTLWDTLLARHPGLMIDNCASGGRRLDFEAISRSVSLFRSDYLCFQDNDAIGPQVQTCGLAFWVPVSSTSEVVEDLYRFRSTFSMGMSFDSNIYCRDENRDTPLLQKRMAELDRVRQMYRGDYYPLTNITVSRADWIAYEMNRPDLGIGIVVSLRRDDCPFEAANYKLRGLEAEGEYTVENVDTGEKATVSGSELMEQGLDVVIPNRRESNLMIFTKN